MIVSWKPFRRDLGRDLAGRRRRSPFHVPHARFAVLSGDTILQRLVLKAIFFSSRPWDLISWR